MLYSKECFKHEWDPVVKCYSEIQHQLPECRSILDPLVLNVFLDVWKAADTKLVSCSHLSARVGCWSEWLPTKMSYVSKRCWQGSLTPPYNSVAENPIPKFDLLERWHLSLVLCSQYSDWFVWCLFFFLLTFFSTAGGGLDSTLALTFLLHIQIVTSFSNGIRWISHAADQSVCSLGET